MIVYGVAFYERLDGDMVEKLEAAQTDDLQYLTCYSVSAYEPDASMFGYVLSTASCLFHPVDLDDVVTRPTVEQHGEIKSVLKELGIEQAPCVYMFENDDD